MKEKRRKGNQQKKFTDVSCENKLIDMRRFRFINQKTLAIYLATKLIC